MGGSFRVCLCMCCVNMQWCLEWWCARLKPSSGCAYVVLRAKPKPPTNQPAVALAALPPGEQWRSFCLITPGPSRHASGRLGAGAPPHQPAMSQLAVGDAWGTASRHWFAAPADLCTQPLRACWGFCPRKQTELTWVWSPARPRGCPQAALHRHSHTPHSVALANACM